MCACDGACVGACVVLFVGACVVASMWELVWCMCVDVRLAVSQAITKLRFTPHGRVLDYLPREYKGSHVKTNMCRQSSIFQLGFMYRHWHLQHIRIWVH